MKSSSEHRYLSDTESWPRWWWGFLGLLLIARLLLIPGEPWEQDEALFGAAAFDTNLVEHRPHPPGFPLWVLIAKIGMWLFSDPVVFLQIVSAALSILTLPLLAHLLTLSFSDRHIGIAAALLYGLLPGVWFHSGRAFSTTPATFLLVLGLWLWTRSDRWELTTGAIALACAVLVRPVMAPIIVAATLAALMLRRERLGVIAGVVGLCTVVIVLGLVPLILDVGGIAPYLDTISDHARDHGGGLPAISWSFSGLGPTIALGGTVPTLLFLSLASVGWIRWRTVQPRTAYWWLAVTVIAAAWILGAHNRTYPRYSLPLLLLCCGPAVFGLNVVIRRSKMVLNLAVCAGALSTVWVLPALLEQVTTRFPALAAIEAAQDDPLAEVVIVDGGLSPFSDLLTVSNRGRLPSYWRPLIAGHRVPSEAVDKPWVYVWAEGTARALVPAPMAQTGMFSAPGQRLTQLSQRRYLSCWKSRKGGIVLEPDRPRLSPAGRLEIEHHAALMLNPAPRGSWLGIVLEVKDSPAHVELDAGERFHQRAELEPGTYTKQFRLLPPKERGTGRSPLWVHITVDDKSMGKVFLHRIWLDRPEGSPSLKRLGTTSIANGAEGLVRSFGFSGIEYFGPRQEAGRWSEATAWINLPTPGQEMIIRLCAPRPEPASVVLKCPAQQWSRAVTVGAEWQEVRIPLRFRLGRARVVLEVANSFVPADTTPGSGDTRRLGVVVGGIRYE